MAGRILLFYKSYDVHVSVLEWYVTMQVHATTHVYTISSGSVYFQNIVFPCHLPDTNKLSIIMANRLTSAANKVFKITNSNVYVGLAVTCS